MFCCKRISLEAAQPFSYCRIVFRSTVTLLLSYFPPMFSTFGDTLLCFGHSSTNFLTKCVTIPIIRIISTAYCFGQSPSSRRCISTTPSKMCSKSLPLLKCSSTFSTDIFRAQNFSYHNDKPLHRSSDPPCRTQRSPMKRLNLVVGMKCSVHSESLSL